MVMKKIFPLFMTLLLVASCTSTKQLTYLNELSVKEAPQYFKSDIPEYKLQYRDVVYIDIKITNAEGKVENIMEGGSSLNLSYSQNESNQYLLGYSVDKEGKITLPIFGKINSQGLTSVQLRADIQHKADSLFNHAFVDVKLMSYKFTVLGEAKIPGTYFNYNNYLTIFEAIGRAGGVGDLGRHDNIMVVRTQNGETEVYKVNLNSRDLLTSKAYFVMPNDVIFIEPVKHKIFNMNLPTISFTVTAITSALTTTLLLLNYFGK
jgi:polysaccharide biosynthesis/export protein